MYIIYACVYKQYFEGFMNSISFIFERRVTLEDGSGVDVKPESPTKPESGGKGEREREREVWAGEGVGEGRQRDRQCEAGDKERG